jgi:hypothetical protein
VRRLQIVLPEHQLERAVDRPEEDEHVEQTAACESQDAIHELNVQHGIACRVLLR